MRGFVVSAAVLAASVSTTFAGPISDAARSGDTDTVVALLDGGADVNELTMATPLHFAAMNGHADTVAALISRGADLEAETSALGRPIHAAARLGSAETVEKLLEAGADPNTLTEDGRTPLVLAIIDANAAKARLLIEAGADVDVEIVNERNAGEIVGYGRQTALHIAHRVGNEQIVELLTTAGARPLASIESDAFMQNADPSRGHQLAKDRCGPCHVIEEGDPPTLYRDGGPPLTGIFGNAVAARPDFEYSKALVAFGGNWTRERLYSFALHPMLVVPGTRMDWSDAITPELVADVVAYFESMASQ